MLPNLHIPTVRLFGVVPIEPFGLLVAVAIVFGYMLGRRRARLIDLDPDICADGMFWAIVSGFVGAHLVSLVFYYPEQLIENPLTLLYVWAGISSFGGFVGGTIGGVVFFRRLGLSTLQYADAIVFGFTPAWIIGRLGCTITFDHPGVTTDFVLGMADRVGVVRHNLGLYEMLVAIGLTALIYGLKNVRPFVGFHVALLLLIYSPVRFLMDFLRTKDEIYWGMTPGQYIAIGLLGFAVYLLVTGPGRPRPVVTQRDDADAEQPGESKSDDPSAESPP